MSKVTFNLPINEIEALKALAASEHKTVTEILRRAMKAELFIADNYKQGNKILIELRGGGMQEVARL